MGFLFVPSCFSRAAERDGFDLRAEQSRVAEAVVRSAASLVGGDDDAQALVERHCRTLTALAPHIVLAWTWFGRPDADTLQPQAVAGAASAYARGLVIRRNALTAIGPAFRTLAGWRLEPFNVSTVSLFGPWRYAAREHGVKSVLALPLASTADDQRGLLVLYADVPRYFELVGVGLFEALAQLFSAVLSRAVRNRALAEAAQRDALTGLPNRSALALLAPRLARIVADDPPVGVVMLDIDRFKLINDTHGHDGGDTALRHVAARLQGLVRQGDTLVRWGGEEFCLCLPGTDAEGAHAAAEKLRAGLAAEPVPMPDGTALSLTASLGVAMLGAGEPLATAVGRADAALYRAKHAGRNRVERAPDAAAPG
jgi:diguanylate cyclase (GGDEF)-like protein